MRRELEDKAARVSDLEEMVGKLEKDKREVEQNFEKKLTKQLEVSLRHYLMKNYYYFDTFVHVHVIALLEKR